MASFGGATFNERGQANGAMLPVHGARTRIAILNVPEGQPYIQSMGFDAAPLDVPIQCSSSELDALKAKISSTASLIYAGGTITATLQDVADAIEVKSGAAYYRATLKLHTSVY